MGANKAEIRAGAIRARRFRIAAVEAARFINAIGWDNAADVVRDRVAEAYQESFVSVCAGTSRVSSTST